ncbi:hypothetical protein Hanom_Chr03g00178571 [Helianthus anomalus]
MNNHKSLTCKSTKRVSQLTIIKKQIINTTVTGMLKNSSSMNAKNLDNIGYGSGLWRGLGTNAQVTIPGGLGFQCDPLGEGFSPGAGVVVWVGLGTNAQVTTPGGLGFRRGPLGGGFSPGVGRGYQDDMAGSDWPRQVAVWASRWPTAMCLKKIIHKYSYFYSFFYHNYSTSSIIISILFKKKISSNHNTKNESS